MFYVVPDTFVSLIFCNFPRGQGMTEPGTSIMHAVLCNRVAAGMVIDVRLDWQASVGFDNVAVSVELDTDRYNSGDMTVASPLPRVPA